MSVRQQAERDFLDASVAVWRHLDEHGRCPHPDALQEGVELRRVEKAAWAAYRGALDQEARMVAALRTALYWMRLGFEGKAEARAGAGEAEAEVVAALQERAA